MSSVRNIANHNRTVVCTIHSPSKAVYELFDSLLLLALGRQTYFGPAEAAPTYFSLLTLGWCMPIGKNPADFLMEANQGLLVASDGTRRTIRELNHLFLNSRNYMDIDGQIEETLRIRLINRHRSKEQEWEKAVDLPRRIRTDSIFVTLTKPETYPRSTVAQMYILTVRQFRKAWKMVRIKPIEGMQIHVGSNYVLINFKLLFLSFWVPSYSQLTYTEAWYVLHFVPKPLGGNISWESVHQFIIKSYPVSTFSSLFRYHVCHDGKSSIHTRVSQ